MTVKRIATISAAALLAAALIGGCSSGGDAGGGTGTSTSGPTAPHGLQSVSGIAVNQAARALLPAGIRKAGVLRIASDPTYAPFEFLDTDNKTMIGWDVDYSNGLAKVLGLKAEHIGASFDTILPGLASGKYDMAISAFNMTPERAKVVDFVEYQYGGSGVAVKPGNPLKIQINARSECGRRIAGAKGSVQTSEVLPRFSKECTEAGKKAITILNFPSIIEANLALVSGRADAVIADTVSLKYQSILRGNKFQLVEGNVFEPAATGLALRKEGGLLPAMKAASKIILGSRYNTVICDKWGIPKASRIAPSVLDKKQP